MAVKMGSLELMFQDVQNNGKNLNSEYVQYKYI